jgi:hypothetical protein
MQIAANSTKNKAIANYPRYNLRSGAVRKVDVVPRSESKDHDKECPFGERASGYNNYCMIYDPEQMTRGRLNSCCSRHATSDNHKSDSRGKEVMNNYNVCTASRLGSYEERNVGETEQATDTHNANTDDRAITTDQIRELINELENVTSNQKQKLTLRTHSKCRVNCQSLPIHALYPLHCDQRLARKYGN